MTCGTRLRDEEIATGEVSAALMEAPENRVNDLAGEGPSDHLLEAGPEQRSDGADHLPAIIHQWLNEPVECVDRRRMIRHCEPGISKTGSGLSAKNWSTAVRTPANVT